MAAAKDRKILARFLYINLQKNICRHIYHILLESQVFMNRHVYGAFVD
jgi:hypothetical protein